MARAGFWAAAVFVGAAAGAAVATAAYVNSHETVSHSGLCLATLDGERYHRTAEAAGNAALVAAVAARRDIPTYGSTIGVATAIQESGLRNLDYGDRDSLGLFQQRPSQGWGTEEEVTDRHHAARAFYWALLKVNGWEDMRVTDAAQAVQRSGFPEAYEDHAAEGAAWAAAIRGDSSFPAIDCDLGAASEPGTVKYLEKRLRADYGKGKYAVTVLGRNDRAVLAGVTAESGKEVDLHAIANWAVASAEEMSFSSVRFGDQQWIREQGIVPATETTGYDGVLIGIVERIPEED